MLRILSLGAGVQSTTVALMSAHGEIDPAPDCAIFADTGWEPRAVYAHLDWLRSPSRLPFPIHVVQNGNIREDILATRNGCSGNRPSIPWFTIGPDGRRGRRLRQCTERYKVQPILRRVREILGVGRRGRIAAGSVEMWMGISVDEAVRAKQSHRQFVVNRYPLLDRSMSLNDCVSWLNLHGYPRPPKSACIGCPFHNNQMWRDMRVNDPAGWSDAVEIDAALRNGKNGKMVGVPFMHSSRLPLNQIDITPIEPDHFANECDGLCGV